MESGQLGPFQSRPPANSAHTNYKPYYRGGQRFAGDSDSPVSIVPHLKLTSVLMLKEPYSIEKCATCLDTFLRF